MSIVDDVLGCTDELLGVRDEIGAIKHKIYFLERVWDGDELGAGTPTDTLTQILPTPYLVEFKHDERLREGGNIKQGDILLKSISRQSYANESDVDCSVDDLTKEKYYYIDGKIYECISVHRKYVYWNVLIRKTSKQKNYLE